MNNVKFSMQIIVALIINLVLLSYLQGTESLLIDANLILGGAYLISGLTSSFLLLKEKGKINIHWGSILRAIVLSGIIIIFFKFPNFIDIGDLIIAQSISPAIGLLLSPDFRKQAGSTRQKLFKLIPVYYLLLIVLIKNNFSISGEFLIFLGILALFVLAQISIRFSLNSVSSKDVFSIGGILVCAILFLWNMSNGQGFIEPVDNHWIIILLFGASLFVMELFFLNGYKYLPGTLSTVVSSASVPMSFVAAKISNSDGISSFLLLMSAGYVVLIYIISRKQFNINSQA